MHWSSRMSDYDGLIELGEGPMKKLGAIYPTKLPAATSQKCTSPALKLAGT
jgi:hypothetical protein